MIYYRSKDEWDSKWTELKLLGLYDGLMFEDYHYRIGDTIYSEPSKEAQEAFDKEKMWYRLQKTKRTNLEVLKDLSDVVKEIEEAREREREEALNEYIRRKQASETKVD